MNYKIFELFGKQKSRGTYDDFFNALAYSNLNEAYAANDYVEGNFVKDDQGLIHIQLHHVQRPDFKQLHKLNYQYCPAGLDFSDDNMGLELAKSLFL